MLDQVKRKVLEEALSTLRMIYKERLKQPPTPQCSHETASLKVTAIDSLLASARRLNGVAETLGDRDTVNPRHDKSWTPEEILRREG